MARIQYNKSTKPDFLRKFYDTFDTNLRFCFGTQLKRQSMVASPFENLIPSIFKIRSLRVKQKKILKVKRFCKYRALSFSVNLNYVKIYFIKIHSLFSLSSLSLYPLVASAAIRSKTAFLFLLVLCVFIITPTVCIGCVFGPSLLCSTLCPL